MRGRRQDSLFGFEIAFRSMKLNKRHIILLVFLFCSALIPILSLCAPVGQAKQNVEFVVRQGSSAIQVAQNLEKYKLINSALFFRLYLALSGNSKSIQAGKYSFHDAMWMSDIASHLVSGKVKLNVLTIPEGWHHRQIGDFLASKGLVKNREEFLRLSQDPKLLKKYRIIDTSTEGYLYPESYMIPDHYSGAQLHRLMLDKFFKVLKELGSAKYTSRELRQRIILASIVEREASHAKERPIIARVFLNRLEKKMKLESCATVQYLFERSKAKLYLSDLARPSPYNTYIHYGMPPGPISNPGRAALEAAFLPDHNNYLYFVVKPDRTHHFSERYSEHLRAKDKYINSDIVAAE